jgi:hypothetical protein
MKALAYSLALLSPFLLISSCQKDGASPVIQNPLLTDTTKIVLTCDTAKLTNLILYNGTDVRAFEITLSGPADYTFTFPVHTSITVAVKPGEYAVQLYSHGNYPNYVFSFTGQVTVKGTGAMFTGVILSACEGPQSASIVAANGNNP